MENKARLHPLIATAAVAVILASAVATAVFLGWLPRSDSASSGSPGTAVVETAPAPGTTPPETATPAPKPAVRAEAPVKPKPVAAKPKPKPEPVPAPAEVATESQPAMAAEPEPASVPPVCGNCGVVEFVHPLEEPAAPGAGMIGTVVGGVVGGLVGNQVGSGDGKKLATAAGAVGGAIAGRHLEQSRRGQSMIYEIGVRFEDGRLQTFTQNTPPSVRAGQRVRVTAGTVFPE
ncbi:MAG TPA: glycine zipper 2TM domain-containing protein [Candidatus Macondimonas sp.]|nr:glycine zipper 2TM domain-containing protein [Candidatus Macondimonas sp.]